MLDVLSYPVLVNVIVQIPTDQGCCLIQRHIYQRKVDDQVFLSLGFVGWACYGLELSKHVANDQATLLNEYDLLKHNA